MAAELKEQKNWTSYGLEDLRKIDAQHVAIAPIEIKKADSLEEAIAVLAEVFCLKDNEDQVTINTHVGEIVVIRDNLEHIVQKRKDGRERYANHALATVLTPFEIWLTEYDNGDKRYAFISLFECKRQMLVVVSIWEEKVLWNFMHSDKKNLNKHRNGKLIYQKVERQKAANQ